MLAVALCGALSLASCSGSAPESEPATVDSAPAAGAATAWVRYVVVLPFENLGGEDEAALVAGLTHEIRNRLTALPSVVAISTGRVGLNVLTEIGIPRPDMQRHFDLILEGSIRWVAGEPVQTRIKLTERGWEPAVWNREWRAPPSVASLLDTQAEIADEVRRILELPEEEIIEPTRTGSVGAYEAYLRGLAVEPGATATDLEESIRWLTRAVREDTDLARAHVLLSERSSELYRTGTDRSAERLAEAKASLDRAIELAPGPVTKRALGLYHLAAGEHDRAFEALASAARELPDDDVTLAALGLVHWHRGELESCADRWKQAFRMRAGDGDLADRLATVADRRGEKEEARLWSAYAQRLGHTGGQRAWTSSDR